MDRFGEHSKFEIQPVMEQKPFEIPAVQSFFGKWCEINDSIVPEMVSRDDWEKRVVMGILEKGSDGKQTLFLPKDLQLWEMVGIMEVVDHDTFATKPERRNEGKEELRHLGKVFQNSGAYIAQRLEGITDGREIARALAEEFYEYGRSLEAGKRPDVTATLEDIASYDLSSEELEEVDRFLAGEHLYNSRQARVEQTGTEEHTDKETLYEKERGETLAQFFRVSQKAFELKQKTNVGELEPSVSELKPWYKDMPIHNAFLAKIEWAMTQKIETPKREFETAIFRRGLEKLVGEMRERGWKHSVNSFFEKLGINLRLEQRKIADTIRIPQLRAELETTRKSGNAEQVSALEREIADKIQRTVSSFPHEIRPANGHIISEILTTQYINCVGASTLGGALMKEAGLNYLVGTVPEHSILFLVTEDDCVEWRDMLDEAANEELTDETIAGSKRDGLPLTVLDIVEFSQNPNPQGLMFDIKGPKYRDKLQRVEEGKSQYVTVFESEYGQKIQILNNAGVTLYSLGNSERAIVAYQQAVALDPKFSYPYYGLGRALRSLGRNEEAIVAYRQAIAVDPKDADFYNGLGNALLELDRNEEAIVAYRQAIAVDPTYINHYSGLGDALRYLGRNEESIVEYQKFIYFADKEKDYYFIQRARRIISELEKDSSKVK